MKFRWVSWATNAASDLLDGTGSHAEVSEALQAAARLSLRVRARSVLLGHGDARAVLLPAPGSLRLALQSHQGRGHSFGARACLLAEEQCLHGQHYGTPELAAPVSG